MLNIKLRKAILTESKENMFLNVTHLQGKGFSVEDAHNDTWQERDLGALGHCSCLQTHIPYTSLCLHNVSACK
jgi:hypothetical protein